MSELERIVVEGEALCPESAAACLCSKEPGHVAAGDDLHECGRDDCNGAWRGHYDAETEDPSFEVVRWP